MILKIIVVVCSILFEITNAKTIPEYIHVCKRNDPQLTKCIRESINILRPKLQNGIPELDVPGLEPLKIDEIVIFGGGGDDSNLKALLKNVDVTKTSTFQITKLKVDLPKGIIRIAVKLPVLDFDGDYDINVRILVAPIKGQGRFHANATNIEAHLILKADLIEKENHKYLHFSQLDTLVRISDYNIQLENLFNGDKVLSQAATEIINGNKEDFIKAATPFIQRKVSEIGLKLANTITNGLEYDELFPEK